MKRLPVEILRLIFLSLLRTDQLECMTVCRQWLGIIHQHCLFHSICIYHIDQLMNLFEVVKRNPVSGTKVERLKTQVNIKQMFYGEGIVKSFPKLREIRIMKRGNTSPEILFYKKSPYHLWCNSIEKTVGNWADGVAMTVLNSDICKYLTYLAVQSEFDDPVHQLVQRLSNAPALKKLYLRSYSVGLKDLELLYQTSPLLTTFSLEDISFDTSFFPDNIKPATSVTEFARDRLGYRNKEDMNQFLRYVSQKYTHIEKLTLQICRINRIDAQEVQSAAEQKAILRSYLKTLGHRLGSLSILYASTLGDFTTKFDLNTLDECDCQIKRLALLCEFDSSLLKQLAKTTQVRYIQSLRIERLDFNTKGEISLEWLRQFTMLKHLRLEFYFDPNPERLYQMDLTHLLDLLSVTKLETLELWHIALDFDNSIKNIDYTALKRLTLGRTVLKQGVDIALSQVFTNLKYLKLIECILHRKTLTLPDSALSYLEIITPELAHNFYILVTTIINNQQRFYNAIHREGSEFLPIPFVRGDTSFGREDYLTDYNTLSSRPYNHLTDNPMLTIVCKSLWDIIRRNS